MYGTKAQNPRILERKIKHRLASVASRHHSLSWNPLKLGTDVAAKADTTAMLTEMQLHSAHKLKQSEAFCRMALSSSNVQQKRIIQK
jgi:hypothetical protein